MTIRFNLDGIQGLARTGNLKNSFEKKSNLRLKTPIFVPCIHLPFLKYEEYGEFLRELVNSDRIRIFYLPPLIDTCDGILRDFISSLPRKCIFISEFSNLNEKYKKFDDDQFIFFKPAYPSVYINQDVMAGYIQDQVERYREVAKEEKALAGFSFKDHGRLNLLEEFSRYYDFSNNFGFIYRDLDLEKDNIH
ncbi:MAG: hypothetical protein ACTSWN_14450, partial [Promethearchaeota archaeon]